VKIGPWLQELLSQFEERDARGRHELLAGVASQPGFLPLFANLAYEPPESSEAWRDYYDRTGKRLFEAADHLHEIKNFQPLYAANSFSFETEMERVYRLIENDAAEYLELDLRVRGAALDDIETDIGFSILHQKHRLVGAGVRVAVLDSGIDSQHPYLRIADSVSTCGESDLVPGAHGTHCAGIIASRDSAYGGIAPYVELLNIKVTTAVSESTTAPQIARGVDEAVIRGAHVILMSLGFNHLPRWWNGGHGWACPLTTCTLCRAVRSASQLNTIVVAAAGNSHEQAEALRNSGRGSFDTELSCPGQVADAVTVGAITKLSRIAASFSSHGPNVMQQPKPNLAAPGVNVMSTIPVPRDPGGNPKSNPLRRELFDRASGTSAAAAVVAGAAALIVEDELRRGSWNARTAEARLLSNGISALSHCRPEVCGAGALDLGSF
jgi:serine protease AprX